MISNFRSGFFDFPSLLLSRCLRSRRLLSCRLFSSSGSSALPLLTDDSEFRRTRRSDFFGESDGSAKISSSPVGRLVGPDGPPVATRRARIASSCDREGRWLGGPRGGTFSPRLEVTDVYGGGGLSPVLDLGGGGRIPLLPDGLSLRVSWSYCQSQ
jgi:hypothetical protein